MQSIRFGEASTKTRQRIKGEFIINTHTMSKELEVIRIGKQLEKAVNADVVVSPSPYACFCFRGRVILFNAHLLCLF